MWTLAVSALGNCTHFCHQQEIWNELRNLDCRYTSNIWHILLKRHSNQPLVGTQSSETLLVGCTSADRLHPTSPRSAIRYGPNWANHTTFLRQWTHCTERDFLQPEWRDKQTKEHMLQTYSVTTAWIWILCVIYIYIIQKVKWILLMCKYCDHTTLSLNPTLYTSFTATPWGSCQKHLSWAQLLFFLTQKHHLRRGLGISFGSVEPYDCPLGSLILPMFEALVQSCRAEIPWWAKALFKMHVWSATLVNPVKLYNAV